MALEMMPGTPYPLTLTIPGEAHHTERTESEKEVERELEVTFHRENKAKPNNCTRLKGIPPYLAPKGGVDRW